MINNISVIIPVYNEDQSILEVMNGVHQQLQSSDLNFELIIVDDGSEDGSNVYIDNTNLPNVRVLKHHKNQGYGSAIKSGIKLAVHDYILIIDADGTYQSEDILKIVRSVDNFDMLIGSRTGNLAAIPLIRKPVKLFLRKFAEYLSGTSIPDLNSGLRIIKKSLVNRFMNILPDGFSFTSTITLAALMNGYEVGYIQINYKKRRGHSKIKPIRDTSNFFKFLIMTALYFDPLKIFMPISLLFLILSISALLHRIIYGAGFLVVSIFLFVASMQFLTIGLLADLIDKRLSKSENTSH